MSERKNMRRPLGVIFDLGGTVLHQEKFDPMAGNNRLLELAVETYGLTPEAVQAVADDLFREIEPFRDQHNFEFNEQSFQRLLYETLGVTFRISDAEAEKEFWRAAVTFAPTDGISEVLDMLAANHIKTAVLSNTVFSGPVLEEELARHRLAHRFSFVATSADYGLRKPNPRVFNAVLGRMGLAPVDVWFVGDKLEYDVRGAIDSGMCAVWYNPESQQRTGDYDCLEVKSWREFMELLGSLLEGRAQW